MINSTVELLTSNGKQLLKYLKVKDSLEHQDASLEATKHIPNQHVDDEGSHAGDRCEIVIDHEHDILDDLSQQLINPTFEIKS